MQPQPGVGVPGIAPGPELDRSPLPPHDPNADAAMMLQMLQQVGNPSNFIPGLAAFCSPQFLQTEADYEAFIDFQIQSRKEPQVVPVPPNPVNSLMYLRSAVENLVKRGKIQAFALAADGITHLLLVARGDHEHPGFKAITPWFNVQSLPPAILPAGVTLPSPDEVQMLTLLKSALPFRGEEHKIFLIDSKTLPPFQCLAPWKVARQAIERLVYDEGLIHAYAYAKDTISTLVQVHPSDTIGQEEAEKVDSPWYSKQNPAPRTV